jgi:hypothetical protein
VTAQQRERDKKDRHRLKGRAGGGGSSERQVETEFLEQLVWALDSLRQHAERRAGGTIAEKLAMACDAARSELEASRPRPAEIATGRMRALWRHEGRGAI